jgi:hypothetical protein
MELTEVLQSVRFVVGPDGQPTDALLSIEAWQTLINWLEELEDARIVRESLHRLSAAGNNPQAAGLMPWAQVEAELDALDEAEKLAYAPGVG